MQFFSQKLFKTSLTIMLSVFLLAHALLSQAIVIRHDKADSKYRVDEGLYPQVFFLDVRAENKICVATLISSQWAITAAHCTEQTPLKETLGNAQSYSVLIADQPNNIVEMHVHPNFRHTEMTQAVDLALIKLERKISNIVPVSLYSDRDESQKIVSLLGWGYGGIGTVGSQGNDGEFRRAQNKVLQAAQWLVFVFDDPRVPNSTALLLEGVPGLGDSGGPALFEEEGELQLMGVALGELENINSPSRRQGMYGATEVYERVSSHLNWIEKIINQE